MICGHDRETLQWALALAVSDPSKAHTITTTPESLIHNCGMEETIRSHRASATRDVHNPEKLAAIIAELLSKRTSADVVVIAPNRLWNRTPSRLDYVVYWDHDHGGTIQVKPPCGPKDADMSKLLVMQQARAFALRLLTEPNVDVEQMIGDIR